MWGHATVHRWSHHVARAIERDVAALCAEHGQILATATADRAQGAAYEVWRKFICRIGFRFLMTKTDAHGTRHAIYARRK